MSLIAVSMNLVLAVLLVSALVMGVRLERRLKTLRDSHESFARAVGDLDAAAVRAEQGLADLRAAIDEAEEALSDRLERARAMVSKLDERMARPAPEPREARLSSTARDLRDGGRDDRAALFEAALRPRTAPVETPRSRATVDDDLFEGVTLKALVGGRR